MASGQECSSSNSLSSSPPHFVQRCSRNSSLDDGCDMNKPDNDELGSDDDSRGDDDVSQPSSSGRERSGKDYRSPSPNDQPIIDEQESRSVLDQDELVRHKKAVYDHPLFPILALLVEKCEYSMATLASSSKDLSSSFNSQLEAFVQLQQREEKSLVCDDPEVDTLMIKAIQILRIHLLEMEKVQDLCKEFCQRYISCLRTKMSSENLLRGVSGFGPNGFFDGSSRSPSPSTDEESSRPPPPASFSSLSISKSQTVSGQTVPISQGAAQPNPLDAYSNRMVASHAPRVDSGNEGDLSDDASTNGTKKSQKRGILPKQATSIMRSWLFQHIVHPYPTEDEKKTIAAQTNLTLLQVNNWFINARRRILQPMLDSVNSLNAENHNGNSKNGHQSSSSAKKLKVIPSSSPSTSRTKSWPDQPVSGTSERASLD